MRITFMPKTRLGKWSVGLIIAFFASLVLLTILIASGQRGGATFFSNPLLIAPLLLAGIFGVSAFFTGIIGIVKRRERSVLVFLATLIGFFVLLFALGEVLLSD
jgi:predicted RND superfamily exporter protein